MSEKLESYLFRGKRIGGATHANCGGSGSIFGSPANTHHAVGEEFHLVVPKLLKSSEHLTGFSSTQPKHHRLVTHSNPPFAPGDGFGGGRSIIHGRFLQHVQWILSSLKVETQ